MFSFHEGLSSSPLCVHHHAPVQCKSWFARSFVWSLSLDVDNDKLEVVDVLRGLRLLLNAPQLIGSKAVNSVIRTLRCFRTPAESSQHLQNGTEDDIPASLGRGSRGLPSVTWSQLQHSHLLRRCSTLCVNTRIK